MEQQFKTAKLEYKSNDFDAEAFKKRLFIRLNKEPLGVRHMSKKLVAAIVIALIILPATTAVAYITYQWSNASITMRDQDVLGMKGTPLDLFENYIKQQPEGTQTKSLAEARLIVKFPLRVPEEIEGFKRLQSIGVINIESFNDGYNHITYSNGPLWYLDLYNNDKGQRVVVEQRYDESMSKALQQGKKEELDMPKSKILEGFGDDLAFLMDLGKERKQMILYHKEGNQVTRFDIWSNTDQKALEEIAHIYLKTPINKN